MICERYTRVGETKSAWGFLSFRLPERVFHAFARSLRGLRVVSKRCVLFLEKSDQAGVGERNRNPCALGLLLLRSSAFLGYNQILGY